MRILLIAPTYLNLYKSIENELKAEGHTVVYYPEGKFTWNPYYRYPNPIKRWTKRTFFELLNMCEKYWKGKLNEPTFNQSYDLLFVIQGITFHPCLTEQLRIYNRSLKTALYIWDTNKAYDFFRNIDYFDKVYSFDYNDVRVYGKGKVGFLPFFWPKELLEYDNTVLKYDLCSIGTNHHGRFGIFKKVISDMQRLNRPYYIRLITSIPQKIRLKQKIDYLLAYMFGNSEKLEYYGFLRGKQKYDFVEPTFYDIDAVTQITAESKAVLDTDNPHQHGTTPRLIWALAQNKHVFTTNRQIKSLPFYDEKYIHIIDRDNPVIDYSLLDKEVCSRDAVDYLRIDNWLKFFI